MATVNEKSWWQSRTIWASVVVVLVSVLGLFGIGVSAEQEAITDTIYAIVTALAGAVAVWGRLRATTRLK